jgi:hypothetical protein
LDYLLQGGLDNVGNFVAGDVSVGLSLGLPLELVLAAVGVQLLIERIENASVKVVLHLEFLLVSENRSVHL